MLEGCPLARQILVLEETDSTNTVAAQLGRRGVPGGVAVFAEKQNAGRGRLGRRWESAPREGLWFSLLMKPRIPIQYWTRLTLWAAVGIAEAVEHAIGRNTAIKWPNDLFIDGKKAAGILIESHVDQGGFAVVGIGLNINQTGFPDPISNTATSLRLAAGHPFDRQELAAGILRRLEQWRGRIDAGFEEIVAAAEARNYLLGRRVEMRSCGETIAGIAGNLDETGALSVMKPDGSTLLIGSGEVTVAAC
jgi:BirA family biotin operon repressor/biotin-[acetyl-CoA-carboxylase] ligase